MFRGNDFTSDEKRAIILELEKLCSSLSLLRNNAFISLNFGFNGNNITHLTGWLIIKRTLIQHLLSIRHCLSTSQ